MFNLNEELGVSMIQKQAYLIYLICASSLFGQGFCNNSQRQRLSIVLEVMFVIKQMCPY